MSATTVSSTATDEPAGEHGPRRRPTPRPRVSPVRKPRPHPWPSPTPRGDSDAGSPGRPNASLRSVRGVPVVLIAMVIVAVGIAGPTTLLYLEQREVAAVEAARTSALDAARQRVPQMLSYSHESLDRDLATARNAVTGPFQREFDELLRTVVRPSATADKISTKTTVSEAGVVRDGEHEVVVLLFINQVTKSNKLEAPRIDGARVRVTMRDVGGNWLVSRLDSV